MIFSRSCQLQSIQLRSAVAAAAIIGLSGCATSENAREERASLTLASEKVRTTNINDVYQIAVEGDYDGALKAIAPILKQDPHNIAALKIRAECYFAKKLYSEAIADISEVIEVEPSRGSYFLRAQIYQSELKHALAEVDYARVVALDLRKVISKSDQAPPLKTRIHHLSYLANCLENQAKWQKAIDIYTHILSLDKDDQNSLRGRSRDLTKLSKFKESLMDLNHLIGLNPRDAGVYLERGKCLLVLGKVQAAKSDLARAKTLAPDQGDQINKILTAHKLI